MSKLVISKLIPPGQFSIIESKDYFQPFDEKSRKNTLMVFQKTFLENLGIEYHEINILDGQIETEDGVKLDFCLLDINPIFCTFNFYSKEELLSSWFSKVENALSSTLNSDVEYEYSNFP